MIIMCNTQHLSNIWSWIYEKVKQHWGWVEKKRCLYKKRVYPLDICSQNTVLAPPYHMRFWWYDWESQLFVAQFSIAS